MLHHDLVPRRRVHAFFLVFGKALGVEVANELLMRLPHDAGQGLEITDVQSAPGPFHQDFVKEGLDRLALRLLHVIAGQVGKPGRHHVPCRDGLFSVQIGRRGSEGVDAQRQPLAAKRRPNSNLATVKELLGSSHDPVFFFQFAQINAEGQPSQIALRVNDEGRDARQRCFFDERLGHHGLSRTRGTEHGAVPSEHLRGDVDGLTGVPSRAQKHAFGLVLTFPCGRTTRYRIRNGRCIVVEQVADEVANRRVG